jgi:hypothetical protein
VPILCRLEETMGARLTRWPRPVEIKLVVHTLSFL